MGLFLLFLLLALHLSFFFKDKNSIGINLNGRSVFKMLHFSLRRPKNIGKNLNKNEI